MTIKRWVPTEPWYHLRKNWLTLSIFQLLELYEGTNSIVGGLEPTRKHAGLVGFGCFPSRLALVEVVTHEYAAHTESYT